MLRAAKVIGVLALAASAAIPATLDAQRSGGRPAAPAVRRETPKFTCPAVTGVGVNTKRRYCDIRIVDIVEDGIRIEVPPHTGAAVLQFDLHNRFTASARAIAPSRQDALVAIVDKDGKILERAAVRAELRTEKDLFDRLAGAGGRGRIATAPGLPQRIRISIPASAAFVSLVGIRLEVQLPSKFERIETVGRPIALVSNFEITYTPARAR
ncbi:MAG: hypothetical protein WD690_00825 [Vicinamibacterales bacterium]